MNLFELFVKIGVDDQASNKLKNISGKLGDGLKTAAKIGTAAVGAAAAGITALTTAAVNNYAEYEQLVGGVETLFGKSADTVMKYAESAYKTAGLSANEYMATVTSFSASLLQSLGGDTEKAADYANRALTDMSDNANKMGTSMEMIQNAYQGFAKQNYTMLDNLKLGYGGTKEEMARLIEEAAAMTDVQKELGIAVDATDMSFGNIVNAISVVQKNMKITGTTADEAGRTIAGSVQSMKSAWTNLVTGLADGNADIGKLIDNLVVTVVGDGTESNLGVFGNIMPAVKRALNGASKLVQGMLPKIVQEIPSIINENLPILAEAAISIIQALVDGISKNEKMLMETALEIITFLAESFIKMLPQIVKLGLNLIVSLANGIAENLPQLVPTIIDVILQIVNILTDPANLSALIDASIAIILALADGLIEALPTLIDAIPTIIENLVIAIIENAPQILSAGWELTFALIEGIISAIPNLLETSKTLAKSLAEYITTPENLQKLTDTSVDLLDALIDGFGDVLDSLISVGEDVVDSIKRGISDAWGGLTSWFNNLWDSLFKNRSVDVNVNATSSGVNGSHAGGLAYVPFDGYIAELHKGERVLTASEAREYNSGASANNTSGITIIQNIQSVPQTPVEFAAATEAYFEQARWAFA